MTTLQTLGAVLIGLSLVAAAPAPSATTGLRAWSHVAAVGLPQAPARGLVEISLPPEVLAGARPDLADLRLTAASGEAVPYVLRVDRGQAARRTSYAPQRTFNPVFTPGTQSTVTVDFGARAQRTRIDIDTPGTNFRRRVMIEAGQDGESWQMLVNSAWLFRIAYDKGTYSKNEISLPDNDFRYLRVTVFNAPDDPEQLKFTGVTAWDAAITAPHTVDVPTRSVAVTENARLKATEIEADLGYENLPLSDVTLACDDANFLRRVEVCGRNARTRTIEEPVENAPPRKREIEEPWTTMTGGTIYRLPGGEGQDPATGLSVALSGQYRYLLVRIFNGDDAALKLGAIKVRRLQEFLAFRAAPAGPYRLYLGNDQAERPQYDLEQFADRLRSEGVTVATLGQVGPNPLFAAPTKVVPWSERYAWVLWVGLGVVLAVLTALVLRQARRARTLA